MKKINPWNQPAPLIYLAPMSGVTNQAYRRMVKKYYADIVFPEFVSVDGLHYGSERSKEILTYDTTERPIIAQLFGSNPEYFKECAKLVVDLGFDGVDINFGCPAPKVAKNGGGCALLGDLKLSRAIIEATLEGAHGKIPVSVKTRKSYRDTTIVDFCAMIADLPLAALCVHGRSFEKPYLGQADLEPIRQAKQLVPFPVMASGHAHTPEAAKETLDYTGADGVALARATFGKPWIGKQIHDYLTTGSYTVPTWEDICDAMLEHARLADELTAHKPFLEMRKVLAWYVREVPNAAHWRSQLVRVNTLQEAEHIIGEMRTTSIM